MKITVTNKAKAPQGIHTAKGVIWVKPGGESDVHVEDHHLDKIRKHPHLSHQVIEADDDQGGDPDKFDAMSDEELREHLTERDGKAPHPNAKRETLLMKARYDA